MKKKSIKNVVVFDLENTVLNKYTDDRVSEVYIVCSRRINTEKLYSVLASEENYDINDSEYLITFLEKPLFFRTIKEFTEYLQLLSKEGKCIAYAHNLDYEMNYLLQETKGTSIKFIDKKTGIERSTSIFRSNNSPIKVIIDKLPNVEFRCSYSLTGYSIGTLGKMLSVSKLPYDYEKIRRSTDNLISEDYEYNDRDVVISGMAIIQKVLMRKEPIEKLPLTATSEMNRNKETFIKKHFGKNTFNFLVNKRKQQLDTINYNFYNFVMKTRQGGLTNLNCTCFNKVLYNVFSTDITSSYPDRMCNFKFPRYNEESYISIEDTEEEIENRNNFFIDFLEKGESKRLTEIKGWFGWLTLINIKAKKIHGETVPLLPLSYNKCILDNFYPFIKEEEESIKSINGKILKADRLDIRVNDIDYEQLLLCYEFEVANCHELYVSFENEYLSKAEISFLFDLFMQKQQLKPEKDIRKAEYMHIKADINANYGRKQMSVIRPSFDIVDGNVIETNIETIISETDGQSCLDSVNKSSLSIDIPSDGCYISSTAKLKLIKMSLFLIEECNKLNKQYNTNYKLVVIYSDTDSLKFTIEEKETSSDREDRRGGLDDNINKYVFTNILLNKIEKFNKNIINSNEKNYRFTDYLNTFNLSIENENVQEILKLGTWDIEHTKNKNGDYIPYTYFKSLGAKKYAYIEEKYDKKKDETTISIKTTIAGCSTEVGSKIQKYCDDNKLDYQETLNIIFNLNTVFDRSISGRTVAYKEKRTNEEIEKIIIDGKPIIGYSGKMIENCSYSLGVTNNDFEYLFDTNKISNYGRNEEDIINYGRVFLECEDGTIVLLQNEKDIQRYFKDEKEVHKKFIYKTVKKGRLIRND